MENAKTFNEFVAESLYEAQLIAENDYAEEDKIKPGKKIEYQQLMGMGAKQDWVTLTGVVQKVKKKKKDPFGNVNPHKEFHLRSGSIVSRFKNHKDIRLAEDFITEGQFSWMTQDTDQQIGSERSNTIEVYMFDDKGNVWYEDSYEGYGEFGGMDYYELLARMNGYTDEDLEDKSLLKSIRAIGNAEMRDIGIALAFDPQQKKIKTRHKGREILYPALVANHRFNWKYHDFTQEADSDPNQSWAESLEYDLGLKSAFVNEAMILNEWGSSDQSIMNKAIHNDAGKPKRMPSPFDKKLRRAAEDAVDFYWDDWEEYETDRDMLIDDAVRGYLRQYFQKDFAIMQRMFEPVDESLVLENTFRGLKPLADEISAEIYKATLKDGAKSATIKATTTTKTWDDGVPVLKYLARGRAKSISFDFDLRPFTVLHDYAHGWFYFTDGRKWYGLHTDDGYDEPSDLPFDMEISDVVVESVEISEGRSINKIKKDYDKVINDMAERVKSWKECKSSGDSKGEAECLAELKELTSKKKALMSELDAAVGIKDIDAELAEAFIGEARSWGTFGTPEAKKVIKQMDKSWDKFSKTVSKAHADFRSDVKSIINSEDGSKSGILDSEGGSYITSMVNRFVSQEFMMDDLGDISRFKYMIELYESNNQEEDNL